MCSCVNSYVANLCKFIKFHDACNKCIQMHLPSVSYEYEQVNFFSIYAIIYFEGKPKRKCKNYTPFSMRRIICSGHRAAAKISRSKEFSRNELEYTKGHFLACHINSARNAVRVCRKDIYERLVLVRLIDVEAREFLQNEKNTRRNERRGSHR